MTPSKNLLRILVVSAIVTLILGVIGQFLAELPEPLKAYRQAELHGEVGAQDWLSAIFAITWVTMGLAGAVGLLFFWRPARILYLVAAVAGIFSTVLAGPVVLAGWSMAMDELSNLLSGAILALVYFSPLAAEFVPSGGQSSVSQWSVRQWIGMILVVAGCLWCGVVGFLVAGATGIPEKTADALKALMLLIKGIVFGLILIAAGVSVYRAPQKKHLNEVLEPKA